MLEREREAREDVPGQYKRFREWLIAQKWCFCMATETRFVPVNWAIVDGIAAKIDLKDDTACGSQELGEFLAECDMANLTLCEYKESNRAELRQRHEEERKRGELSYSALMDLINWVHTDPDYYPADWYAVGGSINDRLAAFFTIDRDRSEKERRFLLDYIRAAQDPPAPLVQTAKPWMPKARKVRKKGRH